MTTQTEQNQEFEELYAHFLELGQEYSKAVQVLRDVKAYARVLTRSGNPARKAAGEDLLNLLVVEA